MGVRVREKPKGSRVWWLFINHRGQRRAKRVGDRKAAELAATQIRAKLAEGDTAVLAAAASIASRVPTFDDVAREWLARYPVLHAIRPGTAENYRSFTERHLRPHFGALPIDRVTPEAIETFIETKRLPGGSMLRGKGLSDASLKVGLQTLYLILRWALRRKLIMSSPWDLVEWSSAPRVEHVDPYTPGELRAILQAAEAIDRDLATMLRVWAQTGARAGEVMGLHPEDVDLERGTVLIRRTWSRMRSGPTKTGREREVSVLHPVAEDTLEWRPGAGDSRSVLAGLRGLTVQPLDPTAFLFTRRGAPWTTQALSSAWRRVLARARVRYRNPEQLRHTLASVLLSRGAPLLYVQRVGGWRSANVLLTVYARWMPSEVEAGAEQPSATPVQPRAVEQRLESTNPSS